MKLFLAAILASAATTVAEQPTPDDLEATWDMEEPAIAFDTVTNTFTLTFPEISTEHDAHVNMQEEFYDVNCKDDGSGFGETTIRQYFSHPDSTDKPYFEWGTDFNDVNENENTVAQLAFTVDYAEMAKEPKVYEVVGQPPTIPLNPLNPETDISGKDGMGMMKFCVRSSIGYGGQDARKLSKNLEQQIFDGYQEVNFIESLITIFFNLTAGFDVTSFNVEPKERIETTAAEDQYTLEAWLCPDITNLVPSPDYDGSDFQVPIKEAASYMADYADDATKSFFNQGALIQVCVAPDNAAWTDGIRMNGITKFTWIRDDLTPLEEIALPNQITPGSTDEKIEQEAIKNGVKADNSLTSYEPTACNTVDFCSFASILFADFYVSRGVVSGFGSAKLAFKTARRLGDPEGRKLQNDPGAASPFDVNVPVDLTDTGPGSLKTAGGSSFGIGTFTFTMALLGAVVLA